jgi:hypothetical protein
MHGIDEKYIQNFGFRTSWEEHSEDLGVDGRIIFEWILGKLVGRLRTGFIWLSIGSSGRLL